MEDKKITMADYQSKDTMTHKMSFLPPSNKKEFTVKVGEDLFTCDTGLDYEVTMRTINKLRAKDKYFQTLKEKQETFEK